MAVCEHGVHESTVTTLAKTTLHLHDLAFRSLVWKVQRCGPAELDLACLFPADAAHLFACPLGGEAK